MHPIERLRYVARASGVDQTLLVTETAQALAAFRDDPAGLVSATRRIVDRHPTSGPLWWLCARVLTSPDGQNEAWQAVDELMADPTAQELAFGIPEDATVCVIGWPEIVGEALPRRGDLEVLAVDALGEGSGLARRLRHAGVDAFEVPTPGLGAAVGSSDLLLLEAVALGPEGFVGISGSLAAAAVARHVDIPVWLVAGVGRLLPSRMWDALIARHTVGGADPWDLDEEVAPLELVNRVCGPAGVEAPEIALRRVSCPVAPELFGAGSAPGTYSG